MLSSFAQRYGSLKLKSVSFEQLRQITGESQVVLLRNDPEIARWRRLETERLTQPQPRTFQNEIQDGESSNRREDEEMIAGPSTSSASYNRHPREMGGAKVSSDGGNQVDCIFCGKIFASWSGLEDHMRTHTKEDPLACRVCGESCAGNVREHSKLDCGICGKRVLARAQPEDHVAKKAFGCTDCGKSFGSGVELQKHKMSHSGKPQKSHTILKVFQWKSCLEEHLGLQTKPRPYKCCSCPAAFSTLQARYNHLRSSGHIKWFKPGSC